MNEEIRKEAILLYDCFTHEGMERRTFMARMVALAGSVAAAEALIGAISADPAAAAIIAEDDKRLKTATIDLTLPGIPTYRAYTAELKSGRARPSVVIVHENRGLNAHTRDVARRMALAGYHAVAPDFLSPAGGTPDDEDKAREMIGKLDLAQSVTHAVKHLQLLRQARRRKVGAVGFCWGGGFVNRLAVAAGDELGAGVVYYGPGPAPSEAVKVEAPLMIHHAGLDTRIAQTLWPWVAGLRTAGKKVTYFNYEEVNHAFNNDTSAERYNKAAADLAWKRTLRFFRRNLA